jgi:hypothetical protein
VPKGTTRHSRMSAFGLLNRPKGVLRDSIKSSLEEVKHHWCRAERSALWVVPIKKLRSKLINAMSIDVATQPAQVDKKLEYTNKKGEKISKTTVVVNPMWVLAPKGAFYKSRRVCSLVTDIVMFGGNSKISHDLERLAIQIWHMSIRHFDGLVRRIRAKMARSANADKIRKSPETLKRFEALIRNPSVTRSRKWFSRNRTCSHKRRYAAMRLSMKVEIVTESHMCKKCTKSRVR